MSEQRTRCDRCGVYTSELHLTDYSARLCGFCWIKWERLPWNEAQ